MFKSYEDVLAANKESFEAFVKSGTTFATGFEKLAKEYTTVATKSFEDAVEAGKAVSECKSATEVMQLQSKLAREGWEAFVAESKKFGELSSELVKDSVEPLTAQYKSTVATAKKKAA